MIFSPEFPIGNTPNYVGLAAIATTSILNPAIGQSYLIQPDKYVSEISQTQSFADTKDLPKSPVSYTKINPYKLSTGTEQNLKEPKEKQIFNQEDNTQEDQRKEEEDILTVEIGEKKINFKIKVEHAFPIEENILKIKRPIPPNLSMGKRDYLEVARFPHKLIFEPVLEESNPENIDSSLNSELPFSKIEIYAELSEEDYDLYTRLLTKIEKFEWQAEGLFPKLNEEIEPTSIEEINNLIQNDPVLKNFNFDNVNPELVKLLYDLTKNSHSPNESKNIDDLSQMVESANEIKSLLQEFAEKTNQKNLSIFKSPLMEDIIKSTISVYKFQKEMENKTSLDDLSQMVESANEIKSLLQEFAEKTNQKNLSIFKSPLMEDIIKSTISVYKFQKEMENKTSLNDEKKPFEIIIWKNSLLKGFAGNTYFIQEKNSNVLIPYEENNYFIESGKIPSEEIKPIIVLSDPSWTEENTKGEEKKDFLESIKIYTLIHELFHYYLDTEFSSNPEYYTISESFMDYTTAFYLLRVLENNPNFFSSTTAQKLREIIIARFNEGYSISENISKEKDNYSLIFFETASSGIYLSQYFKIYEKEMLKLAQLEKKMTRERISTSLSIAPYMNSLLWEAFRREFNLTFKYLFNLYDNYLQNYDKYSLNAIKETSEVPRGDFLIWDQIIQETKKISPNHPFFEIVKNLPTPYHSYALKLYLTINSLQELESRVNIKDPKTYEEIKNSFKEGNTDSPLWNLWELFLIKNVPVEEYSQLQDIFSLFEELDYMLDLPNFVKFFKFDFSNMPAEIDKDTLEETLNDYKEKNSFDFGIKNVNIISEGEESPTISYELEEGKLTTNLFYLRIGEESLFIMDPEYIKIQVQTNPEGKSTTIIKFGQKERGEEETVKIDYPDKPLYMGVIKTPLFKLPEGMQ